ncbi:hypothetical protein FOZ61_007666 [Perkinsus olseni]|uniref:Hypoxia up-regulated protein 1 n=1 Tax=Perkinsus olseni TaxID=32597 RepID=A0A7J6L7X9_PEROL|nr:hypothetical protein FOZ61_007666 [Perkinsus olseni]
MAALRHPSGHAKLLFFTFLLLAALALEQEPELPTGIDFGSYSLKMATVGEHGADLVVNSLSERSTATAVSFAHDVRAFGSQALSDASRKPSKVFSGPEIAHFKSTPAVVNGTLLRAEELVAQSLRNAKVWLPRSPRPVVLTVPASAGQRQRRALLHAAELAGLRVDGLVTEAVAAAVVRSQDFLASTERTRTEVIVDVGAGHTEMCKVRFGREETRGLLRSSRRLIADVRQVGATCVSDETAGTLLMDRRLAEAALRSFESKHGEIPKGAAREKARRRLELQAATVRGILSANHEAAFTVESLYNGEDLSMKVTREEFEKAVSDLTKRISDLAGRLAWEDVMGIELVGGGSRIPVVQEHLETQVLLLAGRKIALGRHLNGDEAPSKGAAVCASNHSLIERDPSLKGNRRIWLKDSHHRAYTVGWEGSDDRFLIAEAGQKLQFHNELELPVPQGGRGILTVFESDLRGSTDRKSQAIERYEIASLGGAKSLRLVARGDQNGIITLSAATTEFIQVKHLDFGAMAPPPMRAAELEDAKLRLDEWDRRDQDANTVLEAMDRLESKMYATRDALDSEIYTLVAAEEELGHIRTVLHETEGIVEKGRDATAEEIISQTEAIDDALAPLLEKGRELEYRGETKSWAVDQLRQLHTLVARIEAHGGRRDDGPAKKEKARTLLDNLQRWWDDVSAKQERLSLKEPPAFKKEVTAQMVVPALSLRCAAQATHGKIHRVRSLIEGIARAMGVSIDNLDDQPLASKPSHASSHEETAKRPDVVSPPLPTPPSFTVPPPEVARELGREVGDGSSHVHNQSLGVPSFFSNASSLPKVGHGLVDSQGNTSGEDRPWSEL